MIQSLILNWHKCQGGVWCNLNTVNLDHDHFNNLDGVYIIWHGGKQPHVVYVGRGLIKDRIKSHRKDNNIQKYSSLNLFVTWAKVLPEFQKGVESYLAGYWEPKEGEHHLNLPHIMVNAPWNS